MAAMGWLEDDVMEGGRFGGPGPIEGTEGHPRALLELLNGLLEAVGGEETLAGLSTDPLPDEPFDRDPLPGDIRDRVGEVLGLLDRCAGELFDVEFRTAVRRLLADVVAADPGIFRRRGRTDTAAIAWIVGKANEQFDTHGSGLSIGDLTHWFGLSGSPSQRAATISRSDYRDGFELYQRAVAHFPDAAALHQGLCLCAGHQGHQEVALVAAEAAFALEPDKQELVNDMGWTLYERGEPDRALPFLLRAVELDPQDALAAENLRICRETFGEHT